MPTQTEISSCWQGPSSRPRNGEIRVRSIRGFIQNIRMICVPSLSSGLTASLCCGHGISTIQTAANSTSKHLKPKATRFLRRLKSFDLEFAAVWIVEIPCPQHSEAVKPLLKDGTQ